MGCRPYEHDPNGEKHNAAKVLANHVSMNGGKVCEKGLSGALYDEKQVKVI